MVDRSAGAGPSVEISEANNTRSWAELYVVRCWSLANSSVLKDVTKVKHRAENLCLKKHKGRSK